MQYFIINTLVAYLGITLYNSVTGNENFTSAVVIGAITIIIFRLIEHLLEEKQDEK